MLKILLLASVLRMTLQQSSPASLVDQNLLNEIFTTSSRPNLEDITVRTTDKSAVYKTPDGEDCKCVPYFLCDANTNTTVKEEDWATQTGFGLLDLRFRDECQESTEVCCNQAKTKESVKEYVPPEASKLRKCGFANPNGLDFTITGGSGRETQFGEFPWVVALINVGDGSCAGSGVLIHPQVVMTAAHNVLKLDAASLKVRAGEWDTQTTKERLPHQERFVSEIISHQNFNSKTLYNDIALLKLTEPVQLADHINVACLPDQEQSFDFDINCVATGWGKDIFGKAGRYAVILKKVELNMVSNEHCQDLLSRTRLGQHFRLHESFVCAGGEEGKDTCQGDGGAPLVCPMAKDRYVLSGLVAWGIGCGQKDVPAVYARVAMFRDWVDNKMTAWGFDTKAYTAE